MTHPIEIPDGIYIPDKNDVFGGDISKHIVQARWVAAITAQTVYLVFNGTSVPVHVVDTDDAVFRRWMEHRNQYQEDAGIKK